MNKPNYIKARNLASQILILQEEVLFPIDVEKIILPNKKIIFSSYENYAKLTNIDVEQLLCNGEFKDSMVIHLPEKQELILYNSNINSLGRILWNKAHELGHIVLNHEKQGELEEIEAHTFASQLLLPQCLLKKLIQNGKIATTEYLQSTFGLSEKAAQSCLRLVGKKLENDYDAMYDDIILLKCNKFIEKELKNIKNISKYQDDELDKERESWLYDNYR
jgi:hypothetical protein